jgi:hypothetical protein
MKRLAFLPAVFLSVTSLSTISLSTVFCSPIFVSAQTSSEVEITAEPHHHPIFANEQVRVFSVEVAPHSETLMYWHRHDSIEVTLGAAEIVNAVKGKDPVTVKLRDGQTGFIPGNFAHATRVASDQTFRNVTIELLQDEKLRQIKSHWDEDRGLDILQNGTKEVLFVKDGVRVSEVELQPKGVLPLSAGAVLVVALDKLNAIQTAPNAPTGAADFVSLKAGAIEWLPTIHRPQLYSGLATKFIMVEFP